MLTKVRNWYTTYQLKRKQSQLKEIDKWCSYIVDLLVEKQTWIDKGINPDVSYNQLDKTLGSSLGTCLRVYHGVYANSGDIEEHAKALIVDCIKSAEVILGKELDKELKEL